MDNFLIALGWAGIYGPTALGAIGSMVGCARAGQAACGAMLDVESGHGKFIGLSAMPSSQVIYGIVIMFTLNREVTVESAGGLFAVGYRNNRVGVLAKRAQDFFAAPDEFSAGDGGRRLAIQTATAGFVGEHFIVPLLNSDGGMNHLMA